MNQTFNVFHKITRVIYFQFYSLILILILILLLVIFLSAPPYFS